MCQAGAKLLPEKKEKRPDDPMSLKPPQNTIPTSGSMVLCSYLGDGEWSQEDENSILLNSWLPPLGQMPNEGYPRQWEAERDTPEVGSQEQTSLGRSLTEGAFSQGSLPEWWGVSVWGSLQPGGPSPTATPQF